MTDRNSLSRGHWAILAFIRFFLAIVVVFGHFALLVHRDPFDVFGNSYLNPGSSVLGFFILSGYSIAASLDRESQGFYRRRFVRIWPLYLTAIAFGLLVSFLFVSSISFPLGGSVTRSSAPSIIASLFMLQTFVADPISTNQPTWSLSAEWWQYMIAPWLKKVPKFVLLILIVLSFFAYLNVPVPAGHGIESVQHGRVLIMTAWLWITGFLYYKIRRTPAGFLILAVPAVFASTLGYFTGAPLYITIFVLIASTEFDLPKMFIRPFNFLGDYSYPLYLFHIPAIILALALGKTGWAIPLGLAFAVPLAALLLVDYPCRKLFRERATQHSSSTAKEQSNSVGLIEKTSEAQSEA